MKNILINNFQISESGPCFIIGELSANHLQDFNLAIKTIHAIKEAGANCVKLQTVTRNYLTIDSDKPDFIVGGGTSWDGKKLYDLYQDTFTPWEWHLPIKAEVEKLGMAFLSSPFDKASVDFLETLNTPAYKIASFEVTDIPLIRYVASKQKPIIMSTGIAGIEDIRLAISTCLEEGNDQIVLLKCTSSYPTPLNEVNLKVIPELKNIFKVHVGLSDHTMGDVVALGAISLGAKVVEKHFILDRSLGGPDSSFSMEPNEFASMVQNIRNLEQAMGTNSLDLNELTLKNRRYARSLYVVQDVKEGEVFTEENVRSIRPGLGLHPKYYYDILGKTAKRNIEKGERMSFDLISNNANIQ